MKTNHLRQMLNEGRPSIGTRIENTWPVITEAIASTGKFDYVEFVAEYAPFTHYDLENIARAAELSNMGTMIKLDFQNRAYVAQKAMASGFQAIMFTDHKTADEVRESIYLVRPDTPQDQGRFGYPNRRWMATSPTPPDGLRRLVRDTVSCSVEKHETMENLAEICAVPGVDMVQFGPSDYSMSRGWNSGQHVAEFKAVEREMIQIALAHGVQARCEINAPSDAQYYIDLGVRHFCLGDELRNNRLLDQQGGALRDIVTSTSPAVSWPPPSTHRATPRTSPVSLCRPRTVPGPCRRQRPTACAGRRLSRAPRHAQGANCHAIHHARRRLMSATVRWRCVRSPPEPPAPRCLVQDQAAGLCGSDMHPFHTRPYWAAAPSSAATSPGVPSSRSPRRHPLRPRGPRLSVYTRPPASGHCEACVRGGFFNCTAIGPGYRLPP
jgi:2-keto-3-deoxy-L-rhamnonate aldolase RhmA